MKTDDVQFVLDGMSVTASRESEKPLWGQLPAERAVTQINPICVMYGVETHMWRFP